jgi:hypothetical protein
MGNYIEKLLKTQGQGAIFRPFGRSALGKAKSAGIFGFSGVSGRPNDKRKALGPRLS